MATTASASLATASASLPTVAATPTRVAATPTKVAAPAPLEQPGSAHGYWLLVSIGVVATWVISLLIAARA